MYPRPLPPQPNLDHLRKQAKALLRALKSGAPEALTRFRESLPRLAEAADAEILQSKTSLRDAQVVTARGYGFHTWADLKRHVEAEEREPTLLEMSVDSVRTSVTSYQRIVVLRVKDSDRYLPIWVGPAEADSIALKLWDITVPRPLTHDLLQLIVADLGARVTRVVVSDLENDTFYAKIVLSTNGAIIERDCRPSDAIALAVGDEVPIFAARALVERAGKELDEPAGFLESHWGVQFPTTGFEKFSRRSLAAMSLAQGEVHRLGHNHIGTEHILLGVVKVPEGVAARLLANLGVAPADVASLVESSLVRKQALPSPDAGLTAGAKKSIELAFDEARRLKSHYVGTEHLLLGVILEGKEVGAGVLRSKGVDAERVRAELARMGP